jgi:predicted nucleotidyltransferase
MSSRRVLRGVSFPREDLALEIQVERLRELLRWREYLRILVEAVREVLGDVDVYVFGSAVEGKLTVDSDIDVAIVLPEVPLSGLERARQLQKWR